MNEILRYSDKLGLLAIAILFLYREFVAHRDRKDRESIATMREDFVQFQENSFKKLSAMHELLREIKESQKLMREQRDNQLEATREQNTLFHQFHVDLTKVLERIGGAPHP